MFINTALTTETTTIDRATAEVLLGRNTHNRRIPTTSLRRIMSALENGEWQLNGEAIKVARDGTLLDGQTRLTAVVKTGIPIATVVISGLDPVAQDTMDTGKPRSLGNVLQLHGYGNSTALGGVVRILERSERVGLQAAAVDTGSKAGTVTTGQCLARLRAEPELTELTTWARRFGPVGLPTRIAALAAYTFNSIDEEDSADFFEKLLEGAGLEAGNPVLVLRNTLLGLRTGKGDPSPEYVLALTITAWNKYRRGLEASYLRYRPGGAHPTRFPEPV